jgi:gliding motility-associated-like protein
MKKPPHIILPGSFKKKTHYLLIICGIGCFFLFMLPATVQAQVQAKFTENPPTACGQASIQFTDQSAGNPSSWLWDFGDGSGPVTVQNPPHFYTSPGTFKVTLTVSNGASTSSTSSTITVYNNPTVNFSMDTTSGCYPLTVNFSDQSSAGTGTITNWQWDFGDGSPFSTQQNPSHTYNTSGNFAVKLTVKNTAGCISSNQAAKEVVTNQGVTVDFSADKTYSCSAPATVNFTATTSSAQSITYHWDFGDGKTDTGKTVSHTYAQTGNYTVLLTAAVNGGGCQSTVTKQGYINIGNFTSDFIIPQGCANVPLNFRNTSNPLPVSATWTFSDGTVVNGIDASHSFNAPGTYQVKLVNNFNGCADSVTKTITTFPSPKADFKADSVFYCGAPAAVPFQNLSQGAVSWKWNFGDNDTSSLQQPTHTYSNGGYYDVSLIATNSNGCADTAAKPKYIHIDAPNIQFNASPGYGCVPLNTTFSLPSGSAGDIASYDWDFGDGTAHSNSANPSHQYTTQGNFTVTLKVNTNAGCSLSSQKVDYIHTGTVPNIDFTATPLTPCLSTPVQFTNKSVPEGTIWKWIFPQNGDSMLNQENPVFTFSQLGEQDVTLQVFNNGCANSLTKKNFIDVKLPKADFTRQLISCSNPYQFQFTDESIGDSVRTWNFGDGKTDTSQNPIHTYTAPGAYHVILVVSNGTCQDTSDNWLQVVDEHPRVSISKTTVCHGDSVTLSVTPFYSNQFENYLVWYNGRGDSAVIPKNNISSGTNQYAFIYQKNGQYTPSLKVGYVNGCYDSVSGSPVSVQGPAAGFTMSQSSICQGSHVTFHDNSTANPSSATIQRWIWDFADGTGDTTTIDSVTHTYTQNGPFKVQLKVTDANGCSDHASGVNSPVITVNPSKASFSTPDTLVCPGTIIQWNNNSAGNNATYMWDFGDGTTSTVATPANKSYGKDSLYTVSLKITTQEGCKDSLTKINYIRVGTPHAVMADSLPVTICRIYQDTSISLSQNFSSILWNFGDGSKSSFDTAYHTYNVPGTYTQKLYINGYSPGCMDSASREITIAGPTGTPVLSDTAGCSPLTVNFSAKNVQRAVSYQWEFGNGSLSAPSSSGNTTYTYSAEGLFHPTLKLTDDTGCYVIVPFNDTLNVVVDTVGVKPDYTWPSVCDSNRVQFGFSGKIFSLDSLGKPAAYVWDFGDPLSMNDVSDQQNPVYRYTKPGAYNGNLKVTTFYGCVNYTPFTVTIPDSTQINVQATVSPGAVCQGKPVQLQASSNIGETYVWSPAQGLAHPDSAVTMASPDATTTYTVTTFSKGNCQTDTASVNVIVHNKPQVSAGADQTSTTGSTVQLQATGSPDVVQWQWSPPDNLSCTACANPESTPVQNMTYVVTGTTAFGCATSDSTNIFLICDEGKVFIPNTFTPNGDGKNDIFYPRGRGVKIVLYFRIYNRFGQLVYERTNFGLNDKTAGWDGTFKGQKLTPQVFVYTTEMICDNNKLFKLSGNVTLLR